jgi:predicted transcriptional regulator
MMPIDVSVSLIYVSYRLPPDRMNGEEGVLSGAYEEVDLIERHINMLKFTKDNQPIGITRLSEALSIPKHKVRYSLRLLEKDGLIVATPDGAVVSDKYREFMDGLESRLDGLISRIEDVKTGIPHT